MAHVKTHSSDVQIADDLRGLLVVPDVTPTNPGPWPGVVMVHEVFGIEDNMRAQAERLAAAGYVVLMPDLYSRGGMRRCLSATFRALADGTGQAFTDVEAAKAFLGARADCTAKTKKSDVGIIGFCMGGGFALQMANRGFGASAVNYGMMPKDLGASLEGACPIVGSYGGKDKTVKNGAAIMEAALTERGIPHDVKEYPEANHAFMNPDYVSVGVWGAFQRITGFKPRPDDAKDAWMRIEKFFGQHLA